jgi:hypothetical protein
MLLGASLRIDLRQQISFSQNATKTVQNTALLRPLLEQQQRRRLKKLWPADLIDG